VHYKLIVDLAFDILVIWKFVEKVTIYKIPFLSWGTHT